MEKHPPGFSSYESLLNIKLSDDITKEDLKQPDSTFAFAVAPDMSIYLSGNSHASLSEKYRFKLSDALTDGYLKINDNGEIEIMFKGEADQPSLGFKGTPEEFVVIKNIIKNKIINFVK